MTVLPVRIAIVGAGPAGFYAAGHLFKRKDLSVAVDMIDTLPTPFGLVRSGVAPDHQTIKKVTRVYDKIAGNFGFRFFGNVEYGRHLLLDDLLRHYHMVYFSTGAQVDRQLGIPGEGLGRSYSATDFVAWYNGHPAYRDRVFDLSQECVAVVGVGNVAVDVCRILCRTTEELEKTDIADYALEALALSRVKRIYMLGRRGPAQAAFSNPEAKELGELVGADVYVPSDEAVPDRFTLAAQSNRATTKKLAMIHDFSTRERTRKPRLLTIRFLVSPVALNDDGTGRVGGIRLVRNALYEASGGRLKSRPTGAFEELPVGAVFRSVGYRGVRLPGLPFNDEWGVIPSQKGRVTDPKTGSSVAGLYIGGWIKRGPTGVIGTNKADALETVASMCEDLAAGRHLNPAEPCAGGALRTVRERQPEYVSWADWLRIDAIETERGSHFGRPRIKFTEVREMLSVLA